MYECVYKPSLVEKHEQSSDEKKDMKESSEERKNTEEKKLETENKNEPKKPTESNEDISNSAKNLGSQQSF